MTSGAGWHGTATGWPASCTCGCAPTGATDTGAIEALVATGFVVHRREHEYKIPVARTDAPAPAGLEIVTADRTDLEPLMLLDCALREEVPGSEGWQPDPQWCREETYDSPYFDPRTYVVAVDGSAYVGLARIWLGLHHVPLVVTRRLAQTPSTR